MGKTIDEGVLERVWTMGAETSSWGQQPAAEWHVSRVTSGVVGRAVCAVCGSRVVSKASAGRGMGNV
jgi:hypothetical protein